MLASPEDAGGERRPLIGRDRELASLAMATRRLSPQAGAPGSGSVFFVIGDAGIGKSALLSAHRAALRASDPGVSWIEVTADPAGRLRTYGLFIDLVRAHAGGEPDRLVAVVRGLLPKSAEEVLPYLETLASWPVPRERVERVRFLQGEELRQQIFRAVYEVLVQQARQAPLVLVFEDLHWADAASVELLADLIPAITAHPILVIATLQPGSDSPGNTLYTLGREMAGGRHQDVRVAPLAAADARTLFDRVAPSDLSEPLRTQALAICGGSPLYLEMAGQACAEGIPLEPSPGNLVNLLVTRIARLDPDAQRSLQLLSVAGMSGQVALVQVVAGAAGQPPGLAARLRRMEEAGWLRLGPAGAQAEPETYAFAHALLCQAAYLSAPLARRRQLHGLIAAELEPSRPQGDEGLSEILAYHYTLAEERERALEHTLRAAHRAARLGALKTARAHFLAAEEPAGQLGRLGSLAEIDEALAGIASRQGDFEECEARYRSALARPPVANSPAAQSRVRALLGREYQRHGQPSLWMGEVQIAQQKLEEAGLTGSIEWVQVATERAWAEYSRADYATAAERCVSLARALDELEPTSAVIDARGRLESVRGTICNAQGDYNGALEHFSSALETVTRSGDLARAATIYTSIGEVWREVGQPERAISQFHAARECYERIGREDGVILVDRNTGLAYLQSADWEAARRLLSSVIERAQAKDYSWLLAEAYWALGEVLLALGNVSGAQTQGMLALTTAEQHGNPIDRALARRLLAKIDVRTGDAKAGRLRLSAVLREFEAIGEKRQICLTALELADALLAAGAVDEAAGLAARAAQLAGEMQAGDLIERARITQSRFTAGKRGVQPAA